MQSRQVGDAGYIQRIIKYIIQNPVKAGLVKHAVDWEFSNAKSLLCCRDDVLTDRNIVIQYFANEVQMKELLTNSEKK